jgi:hypothetical protein
MDVGAPKQFGRGLNFADSTDEGSWLDRQKAAGRARLDSFGRLPGNATRGDSDMVSL